MSLNFLRFLFYSVGKQDCSKEGLTHFVRLVANVNKWQACRPANLSTDDETINGERRMTNEKERRTKDGDGLRTNRSVPDCLTAVTVTTD